MGIATVARFLLIAVIVVAAAILVIGPIVGVIYFIMFVSKGLGPNEEELARGALAGQMVAGAGTAIAATAAFGALIAAIIASVLARRAFQAQRDQVDQLKRQGEIDLTPCLTVRQWTNDARIAVPNEGEPRLCVQVQFTNAGRAMATHIAVELIEQSEGVEIRTEAVSMDPGERRDVWFLFDDRLLTDLENGSVTVRATVSSTAPQRGIALSQPLWFECRLVHDEKAQKWLYHFDHPPQLGIPRNRPE